MHNSPGLLRIKKQAEIGDRVSYLPYNWRLNDLAEKHSKPLMDDNYHTRRYCLRVILLIALHIITGAA
jgi:hypothetical protein